MELRLELSRFVRGEQRQLNAIGNRGRPNLLKLPKLRLRRRHDELLAPSMRHIVGFTVLV